MENFTKITDEMVEKIPLSDLPVCSKVGAFIKGIAIGNDTNIASSLYACESPIEQLFSVVFASLPLSDAALLNPHIYCICVENQHYVLTPDENSYRLDFWVSLMTAPDKKEYLFDIECDGHDFHQKTKRQVERDHERDHVLQSMGYEVIRFSGSEIWAKPYECALTALKIILNKSGVWK